MNEETKFLIEVGGFSMVLSIIILATPIVILTKILGGFLHPIEYFCYLVTLPFWVFLYVHKCFSPLMDRFLLFFGGERLKKILNPLGEVDNERMS